MVQAFNSLASSLSPPLEASTKNSASTSASATNTQPQGRRSPPKVPCRVPSVTFSPETTMAEKEKDGPTSTSLHDTVHNISDMTDDLPPQGQEIVDARVVYPDYAVQGTMLAAANSRSTLTHDSQTAALAGIPGFKKKRPSFIKQSKNFLKRRGSKARSEIMRSLSQAGDTTESRNDDDPPSPPRDQMHSPVSNLTNPTGIMTVKSDEDWDSESTGSYASCDESHDYSYSTDMSSRRSFQDHGIFGSFMASSERALGTIAQSFDKLFEGGSYDESDDETRTIGSGSDFAPVRESNPKPKARKPQQSPEPAVEKTSEDKTPASTSATNNRNLSNLKSSLKKRSSSTPRSVVRSRREVTSEEMKVYPLERQRSEEELAAETMVLAVESWFGARYGRECTPTKVRFGSDEDPTMNTTIQKPVEPTIEVPSNDAPTKPDEQKLKKQLSGTPKKDSESPVAKAPSPLGKLAREKRLAQAKLAGQEKSPEKRTIPASEKTPPTPDKQEFSPGNASRQDSQDSKGKTKYWTDVEIEKTGKPFTGGLPPSPLPDERTVPQSSSPLKRGRRIGRSLGEVWRVRRGTSKDKKKVRGESPAKKQGAPEPERAPSKDWKKVRDESLAQKKDAREPERVPGEDMKKDAREPERVPGEDMKKIREESPARKTAQKTGVLDPDREHSREKKPLREESLVRKKSSPKPESGEKTSALLETPKKATKPEKMAAESSANGEADGRGSPDAIAAALKRKSRYSAKNSRATQSSAKKDMAQETASSPRSPNGVKKATYSSAAPAAMTATAKPVLSKEVPGKKPAKASLVQSIKNKVAIFEETKNSTPTALPPRGPQISSGAGEMKPKRAPGSSAHPKASLTCTESPVLKDPTSKSKRQGILSAIRRKGMNLLNSENSKPAKKDGNEEVKEDEGFKTTIILTSNKSSLNPTSAGENTDAVNDTMDDEDSTILETTPDNLPGEYTPVRPMRPISPSFGPSGAGSLFCSDITEQCSNRCTYRLEDPDSPQQQRQLCHAGFLSQLQSEATSDSFATGIQGHIEAFVAGLTGSVPAGRTLMQVPSADETGKNLLCSNNESPPKEGGICSQLGLGQVEKTSEQVAASPDIHSFLGAYKEDLGLQVRHTFSLEYFDEAMAQASKDWSNLAVAATTQNEQRLTDSAPTSSKEATAELTPTVPAAVKAVQEKPGTSPKGTSERKPKNGRRNKPPSPGLDQPRKPRRDSSSSVQSPTPLHSIPQPPRSIFPVSITASRQDKVFFPEEEKQEKSDWVTFDSEVFVTKRRTVKDLFPGRIDSEEEKVSTPDPGVRRRTPLDGLVFPVAAVPKVVAKNASLKTFVC